MIGLHVIALVFLAHVLPSNEAAAAGAAIGALTIVPQLSFFWGFQGPKSLMLWMMLLIFPTLFLWSASLATHWNHDIGVLAMPFIWLAIEYFRCELSPLKFAWLTPAHALSGSPMSGLLAFGGYTFGFCGIMVANLLIAPRIYGHIDLLQCLIAWLILAKAYRPIIRFQSLTNSVEMSGVEMEGEIDDRTGIRFLDIRQVISRLDECLARNPNAKMIIAPEYTLGKEPQLTDEILEWCRQNRVHLAIGGKRFLDDGTFRNTVFVVSPEGEVVFEQAKSVPIPGGTPDGKPALEQKLWDSPWGPIGFLICYDLQFTRVADELVRLGAKAIIVVAMDVRAWGEHEHRLHERLAQVISARCGLDVLRVVSSGMCQLYSNGKLVTTSDVKGIITANISWWTPQLPFDSCLSRLAGPVPLGNRRNRSKVRAA